MKKKCLLSLSSLLFLITVCTAQHGKWITLFDGASTEKLRGYNMEAFPEDAWKVEDSALVTQTGVPNIDLVANKLSKILNWTFTGKFPKRATVVYFITCRNH